MDLLTIPFNVIPFIHVTLSLKVHNVKNIVLEVFFSKKKKQSSFRLKLLSYNINVS